MLAQARRTALPVGEDGHLAEAARPGWWSASPSRSGSCCTRSPPRLTLSTWIPRHTASTGRSDSRALLPIAPSRGGRAATGPPVAGVGLLPVAGRRPDLLRRSGPGRPEPRPSSRTRRLRSVSPAGVQGRGTGLSRWWDEHGLAAGRLHRVEVDTRHQRRVPFPRPPRGHLAVHGHADEGTGSDGWHDRQYSIAVPAPR